MWSPAVRRGGKEGLASGETGGGGVSAVKRLSTQYVLGKSESAVFAARLMDASRYGGEPI